MLETIQNTRLPENIEKFLQWEPNDGFKYEWNKGEIIKFGQRSRQFLNIFSKLTRHFHQTKAHAKGGELIS
jgi:hypothetical protein